MTDASLLAYVQGRTGLRAAGVQQQRLIRELDRARGQAGLSSAAYVELLQREPAAFEALLDGITVRETYFFRERQQLELLRDRALAGDAAHLAPRPLRAWSAGCASGEEAFTLAMLLGGAPSGVDVVGTDVSAAALHQAQQATYGRRAVRALTDQERATYFEPAGTRLRVRRAWRRRVRFAPGNLIQDAPGSSGFDVVLCRNVFIYFTADAIAAAVDNLVAALAPGGWLLTGSADPPLDADGLERVPGEHGLMYRRRPLQSTSVTPRPVDRPTTTRAGSDAAEPAADGKDAAMAPAAQAATVGPAASAPHPALPASVAEAEQAIAAAPLDVDLRYRLAVLQMAEGDLRAATTAATGALFLDPTFIPAHLLLARLHEALGDTRRARRCFLAAAQLLDQLPGDAVVRGTEADTAESLARVVGAALGVPAQGAPDG